MCICFIHQIYWWWRCFPWRPACRNRLSKGPEDPWRADVDAPRPGWRSGTPSIQPGSPVTSYTTSRSRSDLKCYWDNQADLQDMVQCVLLKPNPILFKCAVHVLTYVICWGTKWILKNVKELTEMCPFIASLAAVSSIKSEPASTGKSPDSWRAHRHYKRVFL